MSTRTSEDRENSLDQLILNTKVLVSVGSGGVGKTTVSAALGVRAAQLGRRTLVLTVDPSKRLATALGIDLTEFQERAVSAPQYAQHLSAAVIDSRKTFDQFVAQNSGSQDAAERLKKNRLYQQLSTTLSGSQEFTSLERLLSAVESNKFDLVILDTPPTKHAIDFLLAPARINDLFQDSVTKWFMAMSEEAKPGLISAIVNRGTRTVLRSLEVLTGGQFIEELVDFFTSIRSVQGALRERSRKTQQLLMSQQTKFILVTSFDAAKLDEAKYLQTELKKMGYQLSSVIVNRAFAKWMPPEERHTQSETELLALSPQWKDWYLKIRKFYQARTILYADFAKQLPAAVDVVQVPEYDQDIFGIQELEVVADALQKN